jgi:hypothetical protein
VGVGEVLLVRLDIEIWEIGEGGIITEVESGMGGWGKKYGGCWVLWHLCVFEYISVVVM